MKGRKNFTGGLSSLLGESSQAPEPVAAEAEEKAPQGRSKPAEKVITKTSQIGTKEEETRATFIVKEPLLEKVKAIAYWDRIQIKDVVNSALEDYIKRYEKANGEITIPDKLK